MFNKTVLKETNISDKQINKQTKGKNNNENSH